MECFVTAGKVSNEWCHARFSTGKTPAFLCFGREMRTPFDVHTDIRAVVNNENFVAEITPYLKVTAETLKDSRERSEQQQDRAKKYAGLRPPSTSVTSSGGP